MIDLTNINKIYLVPGSTDLRLGIDGYSVCNALAFTLIEITFFSRLSINYWHIF